MKIDIEKVIESMNMDGDSIGESFGEWTLKLIETIDGWYEKEMSPARVVVMILRHETLNDMEKIVGVLLLGTLVGRDAQKELDHMARMEKVENLLGHMLGGNDQ